MASQSPLEEVEPCSNGEAGLQSAAVHDQGDERTATSLSTDASLASNPPDKDHALYPPTSIDTPVVHAAHAAPPEEAQKGQGMTQVMDIIEEPLLPDNATPSSIPSTVAVVTDGMGPASTPSTAAITEDSILLETTPLTAATEIEPIDASGSVDDAAGATEAITELCTQGITIEDAAVDTISSTEAVIVDPHGALDCNEAVLMPPREASTEAVILGSPIKDADSIAVATVVSSVVAAADSTAPVGSELSGPVTTDSVLIEAISTDPTSSPVVSSPSPCKAGNDPPSEELDQFATKQEEELPPEIDSIQVPAHWHSKPCVHISSIGGALTEEDKL